MAHEIERFLSGLNDFEPTVLTDDMKSELDIIDRGEASNNLGKTASQALGQTSTVKGNVTPGQKVQGRTPIGASEPDEVADTGKALSQVGKALENPAVINFLADMGIAFGQGDPTEPGVILGEAAKKQVQGQGVARVASELLSGKPLSEIDTSGLGPQGLKQAFDMAQTQQRTEVAQERAETERTQVEGQLDISQEQVRLEEQAQELEAQGLELDREALGIDRLETEADIANAEAQLAVEQNRARTLNTLTRAQAQYYRARAEALSQGDETDPRIQAQLDRARNESITVISDQLETERSRLRNLEAQLEDTSEPTTLENILRIMPGFEGAVVSGVQNRAVRIDESGLSSVVERQKQLVENLEEELSVISTGQGLDTGEGESTEEGETTQATEEQNLGTRENPIPLTEGNANTIEAGQVVRNDNGALLEKTETGWRQLQ